MESWLLGSKNWLCLGWRVCMCICKHVYCVRVCLCACEYVCMCACVYIYVWTNMCLCMHGCICAYVNMCLSVCICACVCVCKHVCVHVVVRGRAQASPADCSLFTSSKGKRPFLLMAPGSCRISEKIHLPRTKQNPQRFFPVSDSRKLPALSSALHIRVCLCPSHFSSPGISALFLSLLSLCLSGLICFSLSLQGLLSLPLSVPPSALAEFCLSLSLFSLLDRAEQSGCQGHPSLEPNPRKNCWNR